MDMQTIVEECDEAQAPTGLSDEPRVVFTREHPDLGRFSLRRLRVPEDMGVVHDWVSRDYAAYWGLVGHTRDEVSAAYRELMARCDVYLGLHQGRPAFLMESYDPRDDAVGAHYEVQEGDRGMHILVSPPERPLADFTWACFVTVMDFLFADAAVARVVVEPDVRNRKIHALNRRAGFRYQKLVTLPHKTAHLALCSREH